VNVGAPNDRPIPAAQHAIQIVDAGRTVHNREKPVPRPGPYQLLVKMEACGICFSDTKLLHAFTSHPRKSEVLEGLDADVLAEIPSYVPGPLPTVPGHEPVGRIVAIGDRVRRHRLGERCLIQTDYRHLPTAAANAAFGYNFEGGLQEYVLLDERMIIEPETDERSSFRSARSRAHRRLPWSSRGLASRLRTSVASVAGRSPAVECSSSRTRATPSPALRR